MQRPILRDRTPDQLREQSREWRDAAKLEPSAEVMSHLLRMAERYEVLADLRAEMRAACSEGEADGLPVAATGRPSAASAGLAGRHTIACDG
jgi:hypothetical protein